MSQFEGESRLPASGLKESVKLVIWDLDETLWSGTLSEGPVTVRAEFREIVRQLNRRGIINSLCSKNDLEAVRARLMAEDGLWDEFVFPRIAWLPKGPQVVKIIEDVQLRPEQVLFIDDNVGNLQEAQYYAPGLQISGPEIVSRLLDEPQLAGRDDPELTRLGQYKLLEQKALDREQSEGSNEDFLRSCDIRVELGDDCLDDVQFERIADLMLRTNQLNYTKRRLGPDELRALLADPTRESRYVRVSDRFGDYGVCGFYSLQDGRLSDFLFSCRILNMGVEQWIYRQLGCPSMSVVGEVATPLDCTSTVDWIRAVSSGNLKDSPALRTSAISAKVLLKGGCDLVPMNDYLGGSLDTEFNTVTAAGNAEHRDHTEVLKRSTPAFLDEFGEIVDHLPFLDRSSYESKVLRGPDYQYLVFSLLMDFTQGIYRYQDSDFLVPLGVDDRDVTDLELWRHHPEQLSWLGLEPEFVEWFAENFEFLGPQSPVAFKENIRWLAGVVPPGSQIVFVNAPEVDVDFPDEASRYLRYREMNIALEEVVQELSNASILDVRRFVKTRDDLTYGQRHYQRRVYRQMAMALRELIDADVDVKLTPRVSVRLARAKVETSVKEMLPPIAHRTLKKLKDSIRR